MLSSMLLEWGGQERKKYFFVIKFQTKSPERYSEELRTNDGSCEQGQGHLHAVPGSEVFVYDLPASQVAHSTCNLDGHVNQVLLRDRLKGNEGEGDNVQLRSRDRKKKKKGSEWGQETTADATLLWRNWSSENTINYESKMGVTYAKNILVFK